MISLIFSLLVSVPVTAIGNFGDWEAQSPGPYTGDAIISHPLTASVITAGSESPAPPVPSGEGNIFCIDAREQTEIVTVLFTFSCIPDGYGNSCLVGYYYSAYNIPTILGGYDIHIDADGDYSNPEERVYLGRGHNLTRASWNHIYTNSCTAGHTIEFHVRPGCRLCIDNRRLECKRLTSVDESAWGAIKSLYYFE